jgi:hypothetical protein
VSLDILDGDVLVVGEKEYPIRSVSRYYGNIPGPSFARMATVQASTKRNPVSVAGKRGLPVENLSSVKITPLIRVAPEQVKMRDDLKSFYKVYKAFVGGIGEIAELLVEDVS